jgi:uncharacterized integral membrane protein
MTTIHDHAGAEHIDGARRHRRDTARLLAAVVLGALLAVFAVLNSQNVRIHWIVTTTRLPMIVVIVGCGLVGAVCSWLIARRRRKPS